MFLLLIICNLVFGSIGKILDHDMVPIVKKNEKFDIFPLEKDFWTFMSEYWLVKSAVELQWDFQRPDYGLEEKVFNIFQKFGIFQKNIKLLIINSSSIPHIPLPGNYNESIFILSLPFIRTLDLSKNEIALLILADYYRSKLNFLKSYVRDDKLKSMFGRSDEEIKIDKKLITQIHKRYDEFIFSKGATFQEQFKFTKTFSDLLKSSDKDWNMYFNLLKKIDVLVKNNMDFKDYLRLYPSPEMQLRWMINDRKKN